MVDSEIFYESYFVDYYELKVSQLKKILSNLSKFENEFFGHELDSEERLTYTLTLKGELRQTYFHSIETFFEILFALDPLNKKSFEDHKILFNLTNLNANQVYTRIEKIASDDSALSFLDTEIVFQDKKTTIGHYIFYFCLFAMKDIPSDKIEEINESIEAIKHGIKIIASDFVNREEYNSYKHGLRIIPALAQVMIANKQSLSVLKEIDLKESVSFYYKTKDPNEWKMVTKIFDTERDSCMTLFCSKLIYCMVFLRRVALCKKPAKEKEFQIPFFGIESINNCNKANSDIKDIIWNIKSTSVKSEI